MPANKQRPKGTPRPAPRPIVCALELECDAIIVAGGDELLWRTAGETLEGELVVMVDVFDDFVAGRIVVMEDVRCVVIVVVSGFQPAVVRTTGSSAYV